jgi:hypothetical protein
MPGDGHPHDKMYMRFRLQYLGPSEHWVDAVDVRSSFVPVGSGAFYRQGGTSFVLVPQSSAGTLRGVVDFEWRRGSTVEQSTSRPSTAPHHSLAGADPPSFSAATCKIS